MMLWWTTKALPWLKKNWQWVLLPIGLLITASKLFKPKLESVSAESLGAADTKQEANTLANINSDIAAKARDEEAKRFQKEIEDAINVEVEDITVKTQPLKDDPKAANEHLLDVGRSMRKL